MSKKSTVTRGGQDTDTLLACYRGMLRIRKVEQRLSKLFADKEIPGFIHLSIGQESVPVAISRHLRDSDTIAATHRGHGQALAKGIDLKGFVAEMMGRELGICRGRGGSMHIAEAKVGMLGANGIVGGGISLATGSALAHKLAGKGDVAVCYFGDGALAEGIFHECLNLAALWALPVLFACENNGWGEFSRTDRQFCGKLEGLASAFGVPYRCADGLEVREVTTVAGELLAQMRQDSRPAVLECRVERFHGHYEGDPQKYRDPAEMAALGDKDPLARARAALAAAGVDGARFDALDAEIDAEIETAVAYARAAPLPDFAAARADVYAQG
ncbi:MAG TPA: thiamine pyrophosphate-dependent dehydrogenase E1 component subunit alpha [Gammaproteobacteria bacterium]|nr:thiamine pyrophosphate-dependent dehydrogenase E1 component subunit alpha [Gammaproteobacteria bacterium]